MSDNHLYSIHTFGDLLRLLRQRAHLTQRQLAAKVDYSDAQINRFEKGLRLPDPSMVAARFVSALGLAPDSEWAARLVNLARSPVSSTENGVALQQPQTLLLSDRPTLPVPLTELFGREAVIALIAEQMNAPKIRLLTLLGPPGIGKTRLAIRVVNDLAAGFHDGAVFVPLASVSMADLIPEAILQALGVTATTQAPWVQIKNILQGKELLLVLDNLEHLLETTNQERVIALVTDLLAHAPKIKILTTSRTSLRLASEHLYEVPTLAPGDAQQLFVARARMANPSFVLRTTDEPIVVSICQRLDYLPLAIELAAARSRLFEPAALLKRLNAPLTMLTAGPRDLPPRQRTLRSAIDWSYALLSADEQRLFRRIGVFADGCTIDAIEAIVGTDFDQPVVDIVQSLVDKSMLKAENDHQPTRFRLLEMLREYAVDALHHSGETEAISLRAAQWFVDQVETMQSDPAIGDSVIWYDWFDAEVNNLREVMQWSLGHAQIDLALSLVADLSITWRLHGPLRDGFALSQQVMTHPQARQHEHLYAKAQLGFAHVCEEIGESDLAENNAREALITLRRLDDKSKVARALAFLADRAHNRGNTANACACFEECIALCRQIGERKYLAVALLWYAMVDSDQGCFDIALRKLAEAREIADEIKSPVVRYLSTGWTAFVYTNMGDYARAQPLAEKALAICRATRLTGSALIMLNSLGVIAMYRGEFDQAAQYLAQACDGQAQHGSPDMRADVLIEYGFVTHLRGDIQGAKAMLHEAAHILWASDRAASLPAILNRLAWIGIDHGEFMHAARLLGAAEAMCETLSLSASPSERVFSEPRLQAIQAALGPAELAHHWQAGRALQGKVALAEMIEVSVSA